MSVYAMVDENGNEYEITEKSFRLLEDNLPVEADIINKSFGPGADFPGIQRDESKSLVFNYNLDKSSDLDFLKTQNELIKQFRKARKIKDKTLNRETEVLMVSHGIVYDNGGQYRGAVNIVEFIQLIPYWIDVSYSQKTVSIGTGGQASTVINVLGFENEEGYVETPPIIEIQTNGNCTSFFIQVQETRDGIEIQDDQFGLNGLDIYIIDNGEGTSELGRTGVNPLDRKNKIVSGTGFFNLQPGVNTLILDFGCAVDITIKWKRRYYV